MTYLSIDNKYCCYNLLSFSGTWNIITNRLQVPNVCMLLLSHDYPFSVNSPLALMHIYQFNSEINI